MQLQKGVAGDKNFPVVCNDRNVAPLHITSAGASFSDLELYQCWNK